MSPWRYTEYRYPVKKNENCEGGLCLGCKNLEGAKWLDQAAYTSFNYEFKSGKLYIHAGLYGLLIHKSVLRGSLYTLHVNEIVTYAHGMEMEVGRIEFFILQNRQSFCILHLIVDEEKS